MGHVGSKTRSLSQFLEKPCVRSRSHILSLIIMKLGQNVCLDKISGEFENGLCGVKNWVKSLKKLVYPLEATFSVRQS